MGPFTPEELGRMRQTLLRRFSAGPTANIVDVAFGVGIREHRVDPRRSFAVRFYVKRKRRSNAAEKNRVPRRRDAFDCDESRLSSDPIADRCRGIGDGVHCR